MKSSIKKIPVVGKVVRSIYRKWINPLKPFSGSGEYWNERYDSGGNSGDGSYNKLAEFKAEIINEFVLKKGINTVIEYGCGDGNQLKLAKYPSYIGFDVSQKALEICREKYCSDDTKSFRMMDERNNETAELTLSLDVIYHLIEDRVFSDYMNRLFDSSSGFVIIYSSDSDVNPESLASHVKHRHFSEWVRNRKSEWRLMQHIPNRFPFNGDTKIGSFADFYIYERA